MARPQSAHVLSQEQEHLSLQLMTQLGKLAAEDDDLSKLAPNALNALVSGLGAKAGSLYLADPAKRVLTVIAGLSSPFPAPPISFDDETRLAARAAAKGEIQTSKVEALRSAQPPSWLGVAVPLTFHGTILGVLELDFDITQRFPSAAINVVNQLKDMITVSIKECLESAQKRKARRRLESFQAASSTILEALTVLPELQLLATIQRGFQVWPFQGESKVPEFLMPVLQTIVDQARMLAGAELGALGIGNNPNDPFNPWVFSGVSAEMKRVIGRNPRPVGTLGVVAIEGIPLRIRDIEKHPAFAGLPPGHMSIKSLMGVPIRYHEVSLGNLYLANKIGAEEFSEEDQEAIGELTKFAAAALQQAYFHATYEVHQAQIQSVLDSAPAGIIFVDSQSGRVVANPQAMKLFGSALMADKGREQYLHQVYYPGGGPVPLEELPSSRALRGETVANRELLIRHREGAGKTIVASAAPVRGLGHRIVGAVVIFADISAAKELERLREELAAMLVHDLRNPVSAIQPRPC